MAKQNILRISVVVFVSFIAVLIPEFGLIISFIGSFGSAALAFIFPSLFHIKMFQNEAPKKIIILDFLFLIIGIVGGAIGTIITTMELVDAMKKKIYG